MHEGPDTAPHASPRAPGKSRRTPETPPRHPPSLPAPSPTLPRNNQPFQAPLPPLPTRLSEPDVGLTLSSGPFYPSDHYTQKVRSPKAHMAIYYTFHVSLYRAKLAINHWRLRNCQTRVKPDAKTRISIGENPDFVCFGWGLVGLTPVRIYSWGEMPQENPLRAFTLTLHKPPCDLPPSSAGPGTPSRSKKRPCTVSRA